ncbi:hypothetical protein CCACVL1_00392, partial [Corchorus capsularis]
DSLNLNTKTKAMSYILKTVLEVTAAAA